MTFLSLFPRMTQQGHRWNLVKRSGEFASSETDGARAARRLVRSVRRSNRNGGQW